MSDGTLTWWAPWALPVSAEPVRDALLEVRGGRIASLRGGVTRDDAVTVGAEIFDSAVLAPGFVNAHAHLEYAAYDALVDGLGFGDWIGDHIRRKSRLSAEHMAASARFGAQQALSSGITCIGDASFSGDAAHALAGAGMRGRVYLEVFGIENVQAQVERTLERLEGLPSTDLVSQGISPHAPYTVSEALYRAVAATGLPWMTHFLESPDEMRFLRDGTGALVEQMRDRGFPMASWTAPPIEALADILGPHVVAVHLVHASPADIELLASTGTAVAHCPRSNARLGCGLLDLQSFERAGVQMGLGTDSPSSAGPLDMFAEMRSALEQHRAAGQSPKLPSIQRLLELATVDAARALGYEDLGTLSAGSWADVVACSIPRTSEPDVTYVLSGSPERMEAVAVAGSVVWRRDRNDLRSAAEEAAETRQLLALPVRQTVG